MALGSIATSDVGPDIGVFPATITNGQSITPAIDLKAKRAHSIILPAGFAANDITFQVSADDVTYVDLWSAGAEYKIASAGVAASRAIALDFTLFFGFRCIKIRNGTSAAAVNVAADRIITIMGVAR